MKYSTSSALSPSILFYRHQLTPGYFISTHILISSGRGAHGILRVWPCLHAVQSRAWNRPLPWHCPWIQGALPARCIGMIAFFFSFFFKKIPSLLFPMFHFYLIHCSFTRSFLSFFLILQNNLLNLTGSDSAGKRRPAQRPCGVWARHQGRPGLCRSSLHVLGAAEWGRRGREVLPRGCRADGKAAGGGEVFMQIIFFFTFAFCSLFICFFFFFFVLFILLINLFNFPQPPSLQMIAEGADPEELQQLRENISSGYCAIAETYMTELWWVNLGWKNEDLLKRWSSFSFFVTIIFQWRGECTGCLPGINATRTSFRRQQYSGNAGNRCWFHTFLF